MVGGIQTNIRPCVKSISPRTDFASVMPSDNSFLRKAKAITGFLRRCMLMTNRSGELPELFMEILSPLDDRNDAEAIDNGGNRLVVIAAQLVDDGMPRVRKSLQVVAAFERRHQAPVAAFGGEAFHPARHREKAILGHPHTAERVAIVTVEA